jgi:hypothetical protein
LQAAAERRIDSWLHFRADPEFRSAWLAFQQIRVGLFPLFQPQTPMFILVAVGLLGTALVGITIAWRAPEFTRTKLASISGAQEDPEKRAQLAVPHLVTIGSSSRQN